MLALLLALGLATSLLVAWAGALVDRDGWPDTVLTSGPAGTRTEMRGWLVEQGRDRTLTWRTFDALDLWDGPPDLESPTELPAWSVGRDLPDQPGPFVAARERTRDVAWEVSAGWPMRCVRATRGAGPEEFALPGEFVRGGVAAMAVEWPISHDAIAEADRPGVDAWPAGGLAAMVPVRPMLGGLVVNTIVFALAWGVALSPLVGLGVLRRWRRRKKDRCVQCGHSVQGLPDGAPCTECGRSLQHRTTIAELLTARAPMLGASLALVLVIGASASLLVYRWMAVDRLPPLHHAAAVGDVQEVEGLLAAGAAVDDPMGQLNSVPGFLYQSTALHWAASREHLGASRALLDHGADPAVDIFGYQPVVQAIGTGDAAIAELLMSALQPGDQLVAVEDVFAHAHPSIQRELLDRVFTTEGGRLELASRAIIELDLPLLDALVEEGLAGGGRHWNSLLGRAVQSDGRAYERPYRNNLGLTRHVLGLHLDIHPDEAEQAVRTALRNGCVPALSTLLEIYPKHAALAERLDAEDLSRVALRGGRPMLACLIDLGVDLNAAPREHFNALWYAAIGLEPDALAALLDCGVDPTLTANGQTLRQWLLFHRDQALADPAAYPDHPFVADPPAFQRILDLLEAAEADWNARDQSAIDPAAPGGR